MADSRPHYSTLLDKDEIFADELSENDMLYLLKSAAGARRDRRISLKTLKQWIMSNEN
jgi:hypothetical protein